MKNLYIIGNGFDCHHGINSSYNAYRKWLEENEPELYERLQEFYYVDDDEWWWQFEVNLGEIELADYIQYTASENQPNYGSDEFRDRDYHAGSYQAENEIGGLVNDIKETFKEWINSLSKADGSKKIKLDKGDSHFINFNYTSTLQELYGVPDSDILHIHGKAPDDTLVLGHNKTYEELTQAVEVVRSEPPADLSEEELAEWYDDGEDYITQTVREAAVSEIYAIRKDVEQIIRNNRTMFSSMNEIEHIYIYGFSFSPVDEPYIDKIINHIDKEKVHWTISYYSDEDQKKIEAYMQSRKISPDLWKLIKLEDIQMYKQQQLF